MKKQIPLFFAILATLFFTLTASAQGEWKWAHYWSGRDGFLTDYYNTVSRTAFDDEGESEIRAVGGDILSYISKVIIQLERGEELNERIATLKRHRSLPEGRQVAFSITSSGIV